MTRDPIFSAMAADYAASKRAGGPFQLWAPLWRGGRLSLRWSYATEAEARAAVAQMVPALQAVAEIRHVAA